MSIIASSSHLAVDQCRKFVLTNQTYRATSSILCELINIDLHCRRKTDARNRPGDEADLSCSASQILTNFSVNACGCMSIIYEQLEARLVTRLE